jgi:hypothetical protein
MYVGYTKRQKMLHTTAIEPPATDTRTDLRKALDALPGYPGAVEETVKLLTAQGKLNKYGRPYKKHAVYGVLRGTFHSLDIAEALLAVIEAEQVRRAEIAHKAARLAANV